LPAEQRERLNRLAKAKGILQAASLLGLSPNTFDRARGGLNLLPGTRLLVKQQIDTRDKEGKNP